MVDRDLRRRGIKDERVLAAMGTIPRHLFVPERQRGSAYEDRPLPIGEDQTISQPYVVALMTELLELRSSEKSSRNRHRFGLPNGGVGLAGGRRAFHRDPAKIERAGEQESRRSRLPKRPAQSGGWLLRLG